MFKKLLLGLWITSLLAIAGFATINTVNAQNWFDTTAWFGANDTSDIAWVGWTSKEGWLIKVVKNFINWILWLLSLIALIMLLLWGFKMVTAAGDEEKYKGWFQIMKQAWVGLAVIGLSWFVVSIIFWVLWGTTAWA